MGLRVSGSNGSAIRTRSCANVGTVKQVRAGTTDSVACPWSHDQKRKLWARFRRIVHGPARDLGECDGTAPGPARRDVSKSREPKLEDRRCDLVRSTVE